MNLLQQHFSAIEKLLIAKSEIASNTGHPLHKGNAREDFIKEFLLSHIGNTVKIGTGEIISSECKVKESRNQIDVVLYNSSFPKINFSPTVDAFLVESVNTTIEIKSTVTKTELKKAIIAANRIKNLSRNVKRPLNPQQAIPPRIYNALVAYKGPASIKTVYKWVKEIESELAINQKDMPKSKKERDIKISEALDLIVLLGKGSIAFDNLPVGNLIQKEQFKEHPKNRRLIRQDKTNNVYCLFLYITEQIKGIECDQIDLYPYYQKISFERDKVSWDE